MCRRGERVGGSPVSIRADFPKRRGLADIATPTRRYRPAAKYRLPPRSPNFPQRDLGGVWVNFDGSAVMRPVDAERTSLRKAISRKLWPGTFRKCGRAQDHSAFLVMIRSASASNSSCDGVFNCAITCCITSSTRL